MTLNLTEADAATNLLYYLAGGTKPYGVAITSGQAYEAATCLLAAAEKRYGCRTQIDIHQLRAVLEEIAVRRTPARSSREGRRCAMSGTTYVEYDPDLAALDHETKPECDRRDNDGYTPGVGDLVNICRDTSKNPTSWYVDRLWIGGAVLLMPFKNGVPGWWWRTTHLGIHRCHLVLVKAASQEALF